MKNNEVTIEDAERADEGYAAELPKLVEVRIIDSVLLGFCFGIGLGAALFCWRTFALLLAKEMSGLAL